jgi:predicted nucleic acid-binding protein
LHNLATGVVSVDASVIVDFHLAGRLALLEELFAKRLLISDFVEEELMEAHIQVTAARPVALSTAEEWEFFGDLRRRKPGLGLGELGALTVARSRNAILLTNDRQARQTAEDFDVPVNGGLGVLEYATEVGRLSGQEAVAVMEEMIRQGAWISDELVELFKQRVLGSR